MQSCLDKIGWLNEGSDGLPPSSRAFQASLFGLGQPVTAQDSSVRILTPPPVAQMFRIGPNGTPAASATLSTLNSIVREPRGLASCGEVGLDLDITYTESTIYDCDGPSGSGALAVIPRCSPANATQSACQ
jgi:hypothetical protein